MEHLRIFVKIASDAMAAKFLDHRQVMGFGVALNRVANVPEGGPRFYLQDPEVKRFLTQFAESACPDGNIAYQEHLAGVAMVAIFDDGDIDIDDVAGLEFFGARYPMTYGVVDGGADRFGEAPIIQGGRDRMLNVDDVVMTDAVQFFGRDPGDHVGLDHFENFGGQASCNSEFVDFFCGLDADAHGFVGVLYRGCRRSDSAGIN